jgi:hypothetical protein
MKKRIVITGNLTAADITAILAALRVRHDLRPDEAAFAVAIVDNESDMTSAADLLQEAWPGLTVRFFPNPGWTPPRP